MKMAKNVVFYLLICIIALVVIIAGGTVYAFVSGTYKNSAAGNKQTTDIGRPAAADAVFSGLGLSRFVSADDEPCTIVAAPYFKYDTSDRAFTEELAKKKQLLNKRIREWFAQYPKAQLVKMDEVFIKSEITKVLNKELVLGSIDAVYFDEFLIID